MPWCPANLILDLAPLEDLLEIALRAHLSNYKELEESVQQRITDIWNTVDSDTIDELTDYVGYHAEFLKLFGFGVDGVDYEADLNPEVAINNLI